MVSADDIRVTKKFSMEIRTHAMEAISNVGAGHVGGVLSIADTIAVLYGGVMNINPQNPRWEDRDYLICSKGHAGPAIYAALALKGYFDINELKTLNKPGTHLPSHCDRNLTTGIDLTTGSLGQGTSQAVGVALGNRLDKRNNYTYLIIGDGEMQEGQVWEAILCAAQQKLENLITFVDYNKKQLDGWTKDINDLGDIRAKFDAFNWYTDEIDGNNVEEIFEAIERAKAVKGKPKAIILNTIKGKGWKIAEEELNNHSMSVNSQQFEEIAKELKESLEREV